MLQSSFIAALRKVGAAPDANLLITLEKIFGIVRNAESRKNRFKQEVASCKNRAYYFIELTEIYSTIFSLSKILIIKANTTAGPTFRIVSRTSRLCLRKDKD